MNKFECVLGVKSHVWGEGTKASGWSLYSETPCQWRWDRGRGNWMVRYNASWPIGQWSHGTPFVNKRADTTENITFSQLLWCAVKNATWHFDWVPKWCINFNAWNISNTSVTWLNRNSHPNNLRPFLSFEGKCNFLRNLHFPKKFGEIR